LRGTKTKMVLQRRTESTDSQNAVTESWRDLRTVKGVLTSSPNVRNGLTDIYDKNTEISTHIFLVDYPIGVTITTEDRFRLKTEYYDILFIANPGNANRHLEFHLMVIKGRTL